ncbi:MAG: helix-turn-helix transcriptional regulator [Treponema sp.]|nr:helix-turn-helix transcriptional regulator [Treponema sp.]
MAEKEKINEKYILQLLSRNVKRFRTQQNISQIQLALTTGLTHNFIHDIESCKKGISSKTLAKLSIAFNVEPYQFFLPEGLPNNETLVYVKDFNDSLQKVVHELTQQYTVNPKKK